MKREPAFLKGDSNLHLALNLAYSFYWYKQGNFQHWDSINKIIANFLKIIFMLAALKSN